MFRSLSAAVLFMSLQAQASQIPVSSNYTGTVTIQVSEYKEQLPFTPGALVVSTSLTKKPDDQNNTATTLTFQQGFYHLSITLGNQVVFAQPVYDPSSITIFANGDYRVPLRSIQTAYEIPAWLWSSIQVKAFDFKGYIEQVTNTWLAALEWATEKRIETKDIISQYPNALFPNDYKEREKLYDLMPSCMHGARRDPEITTPFPNVMNLSWHLIQARWMQDHPDFKVHPTDQEIKDAEQLLNIMGYPIHCHPDK